MGNLKEYKGTFELAIEAAKRDGLKYFTWYNPAKKKLIAYKVEDAPKENLIVTTSLSKQRQANSKLVKRTSREDEVNAGNLGTADVNAAYTKIKRGMSQFLPVDTRTDLVDKNGNTRVYYNYTNGIYYVTDNDGNIIGRTSDENARNVGFKGFYINTGSGRDEITRRAQLRLARDANTNEVNQVSKLQYDRMVGDDYSRRVDSSRHFGQAMDVASGYGNALNHTVMGAAKAVTDPNYTFGDYVSGFTPEGMVDGQTIVGLGDYANVSNPFVRGMLNFVNPTAVMLTNGQPSKSLTVVLEPGEINQRGGQWLPNAKVSKFEIDRGAHTNPNKTVGSGTRGAKGNYGVSYPIHSGRNMASTLMEFVPALQVKDPIYGLQTTQGYINPGLWGGASQTFPESSQVKETVEPVTFYYDGDLLVNSEYLETGELPAYTGGAYRNGRLPTVTLIDSNGRVVPANTGAVFGVSRDSRQYPSMLTH